MNSQPMCACPSPRSAPRQPPSWPAWGECGSPSWSENAWCLRWSATHEMTGPSIAADPSAPNVARSHGLVWKLRCVSSRWKPTVTPIPVRKYMIASTARSLQCSQPCQVCQPTTKRPAKGTPVTNPVMIRSRVSCSVIWMSSAVGVATAESDTKFPVRQGPTWAEKGTLLHFSDSGGRLGHSDLVHSQPESARHARVRAVLLERRDHVVDVHVGPDQPGAAGLRMGRHAGRRPAADAVDAVRHATYCGRSGHWGIS